MTVIDQAFPDADAHHDSPPPLPVQPAESRGLSWYLDAFLQPGNIKWLLIAGVLILLASSLMLVSAQWDDYTPAWKYVILLGYTAGTWLAGRWTYHRLALRRTGTVIMGLTVLLVPVSFLTLNLLATGPPWVVMFALNLVVAAAAARDVFRHFLRGDQPTFLACYLLLCAAGAFVTSPAGPIGASLMALGLWATFAIGAVKVNRHVFWLVEEHRWPRVFGFFPILLLGGQFLALYALGPAGHLPAQWMGLGCAMVAAVVLATSDSIARVFQQLTGDLVRPLPWAIIAPLVVGLTLCATALCLAGTGLLPPGRPYAMVPTAALVAGLLGLVARRTNRREFVWAALAVATVAYNFSPVFFRTLAGAAVAQGATAIGENTLPFAFYGLTYLPLLAALIGLNAIARRRGWTLVLDPVRGYCFGLSFLLLVASLGHAKAMFPVAAAMTVIFTAQAFAFHDRRPVLPAIAAWVIAAAGACAFLRGVSGFTLPYPAADFTAVAAAAMLLLVPGAVIDTRLRRTPQPTIAGGPCQVISLLLAVALPAIWITAFAAGSHSASAWLAAVAVSVLLLAHSLRWVSHVLSTFALCIVSFFALRLGLMYLTGPGVLLSIVTLALLAVWITARWLGHNRPAWRVSRAFATPGMWVSGGALTAMLVCIYLPALSATALGGGWLLPTQLQPWTIVAAVIVTWGFGAARRWASPLLATAACLATFATVGAALAKFTGNTTWLPATLALSAIIGLLTAEWLTRRAGVRGWRLVADTATAISLGALAITAVATLAWYTPALRVAGAVAAVGLIVASRFTRLSRPGRALAVALASWQPLAFLLTAFVPASVTSIAELRLPHLIVASLPLAALASVGLLAWQRFGDRLDVAVARGQRVLLRGLITGCLVVSTAHTTHATLELLLATGALAALIGSELWSACRRQDAARAWSAQLVLLAAVAYFMHGGVIHIGRELAVFAPLAAALAFRGVAALAVRRPSTAVLSGPFALTAIALPMATVAAALAREALTPNAGWLGMSSLALFLAAGFYFWRGLERRQPAWHVVATGIANVALALLWHELRWSDPQFYMVPLGASVLLLVQVLKREIPTAMHDSLRYTGALLVLVSPTFHIVGGSWAHLLSLMLLSVGVMLAGMGLRVRAMLYAGSAFLAADLVAMVVRGSIDQPSLLWLAGLAVGTGVLTLGALAERNREQLLQRVRLVSAALAEWD